jgi:hypothetical protein
LIKKRQEKFSRARGRDLLVKTTKDAEKPFVLVSLFSNKTSFYVTAPLHASHTVADSGDWAAYVMAMGGAILPRCNRPIHPYYETKKNETVDIETGEIIQNNLTF